MQQLKEDLNRIFDQVLGQSDASNAEQQALRAEYIRREIELRQRALETRLANDARRRQEELELIQRAPETRLADDARRRQQEQERRDN